MDKTGAIYILVACHSHIICENRPKITELYKNARDKKNYIGRLFKPYIDFWGQK